MLDRLVTAEIVNGSDVTVRDIRGPWTARESDTPHRPNRPYSIPEYSCVNPIAGRVYHTVNNNMYYVLYISRLIVCCDEYEAMDFIVVVHESMDPRFSKPDVLLVLLEWERGSVESHYYMMKPFRPVTLVKYRNLHEYSTSIPAEGLISEHPMVLYESKCHESCRLYQYWSNFAQANYPRGTVGTRAYGKSTSPWYIDVYYPYQCSNKPKMLIYHSLTTVARVSIKTTRLVYIGEYNVCNHDKPNQNAIPYLYCSATLEYLGQACMTNMGFGQTSHGSSQCMLHNQFYLLQLIKAVCDAGRLTLKRVAMQQMGGALLADGGRLESTWKKQLIGGLRPDAVTPNPELKVKCYIRKAYSLLRRLYIQFKYEQNQFCNILEREIHIVGQYLGKVDPMLNYLNIYTLIHDYYICKCYRVNGTSSGLRYYEQKSNVKTNNSSLKPLRMKCWAGLCHIMWSMEVRLQTVTKSGNHLVQYAPTVVQFCFRDIHMYIYFAYMALFTVLLLAYIQDVRKWMGSITWLVQSLESIQYFTKVARSNLDHGLGSLMVTCTHSHPTFLHPSISTMLSTDATTQGASRGRRLPGMQTATAGGTSDFGMCKYDKARYSWQMMLRHRFKSNDYKTRHPTDPICNMPCARNLSSIQWCVYYNENHVNSHLCGNTEIDINFVLRPYLRCFSAFLRISTYLAILRRFLLGATVGEGQYNRDKLCGLWIIVCLCHTRKIKHEQYTQFENY